MGAAGTLRIPSPTRSHGRRFQGGSGGGAESGSAQAGGLRGDTASPHIRFAFQER